jgi:hypothetical protein
VNRAVALAFLIGVVLLSDLAVVGVHVLNDHTSLVTARSTSSQAISADAGPKVVPGQGQAFVTGDLDRAALDGAQGQPLPLPFTITALERGQGRVTIEHALMGDRRVTITWDSGTPLPVSGAGAGLDLGATHVEVSKDGPVLFLDGAPRSFLPGSYTLGTTVAVGTGGLATPRDGVQFTADQQTTLESNGNVVIHLDPQKLVLQGPGKLSMNGHFKVQYPKKSANATTINFAEAPYQVTVDPTGSGVHVDAILQGPVDAS